MELITQKRTELGKKSKKLKADKKIPGVIFAREMESMPIAVDYHQFEKIYKAAGESSLVDIKIEDEKGFKVLISKVDYHPVSGKIHHINLHKVNLKEKITANVPLVIIGESEAVKSNTAILLTLLDEVAVEALPTDLPHDIQVDISGLTEIGQGIYVGDLKVDRTKVEIVGHEPEDLVLKLDHAVMEEEEEPTKTEAELIAEVEASSEKEESEEDGDKEE